MILVDRERELALLDRLLADALGGAGRTAIVSGPPATGKSALLEEFTQRAADAGALVLSAVGAPEEAGLDFGVLHQLGRTAPIGRPDVQAACAAVLGLADSTPLALVVDDADCADAASLLTLLSVARRMRTSRIILVVAEPEPPTAFRRDLLRRPNSHLLRVGPLAAEAVARLGADDPAALHACTGGNPLMVAALLAGDPYDKALRSFLDRGTDGQREAAAALAVLGEPEATYRLLDRDPPEVARFIQELEDAGVLAGGRFRDPRGAEAVLAGLDPGRRLALHHRAAALGYEDGRPAAAIAAHLVAARRLPEPWAIPVLETAAAQALAAGSTGPGIEFLKLACAACADEPRLARMRTTLIRAEWRIDPSAPASLLSELADAHLRGHLGGRDALVLVRALLWHGRFDDARDILARLADSEAIADPETLTELRNTRLLLRCSYAPFAEYLPQPDAPSTPTLADGHRLGAVTALDTVLTRGPSEEVVLEAERILRNARLDEPGMDTVESALLALTYGEQSDRAAPWCDGLLEEAEHRQSPGRYARLSTVRAEISFRQGDLPAAERHARRALDTVPAASWGVTVGATLASLLLPLLAMGEHEVALDELGRPVPEGMLQSRYGLHYLQARGRCSAAAGSPDAALGDFRACGELMSRWALDTPGLIAWRVDAADALLLMGERDSARALLEEHLTRCGRGTRRTQGAALRLIAASMEPRQRPAVLRKAAEILETAGDRYELARALTDLALAYYALGEPRRASMIGRRAWGLATECGATPLIGALATASGTDLSLSATGADRAGGPGLAEDDGAGPLLSQAEQRVAELAAAGYTNREISKRLYITVSTVEQHLTRAYRKLSVANRADLPAALERV